MASFEQLVKEKTKLFDSVPEQFATDATRVQAQTWREILPLIQSMDVDSDGNITQSNKNIERVGIIADKLNQLLAGNEYRDAVKKFFDGFDRGVQLTTEIAQKFDPNFEPTTAQKNLIKLFKKNAIDTFIGAGVNGLGLGEVIQPFIETLTSNLAARAPLGETVRALELVVRGSDTTDGKLLGMIKRTATTAQAVADRSYAAVANETIGAQFFKYVGGEIPTTRPFCAHREGEIWHQKEIEAWGNGINSGGLNDIRDETWAGRIEGTDSRSIFTFVGGWNCRHYLVPIIENRVPDSVKARAEAEGYYNPK
jgi:hypothetical protein